MLRGSSCCVVRGLHFSLSWAEHQPAHRADPNYRVLSVKQGKSVSSPAKGKYIVRWTEGDADKRSGRKRRLLCNGADTGCAVFISNITGRESGQTSLWYFTRDNKANRLMRQSR